MRGLFSVPAWRYSHPARAGSDRRRRRARRFVQAAGRHSLLGARPGRLPCSRQRHSDCSRFGDAIAGELGQCQRRWAALPPALAAPAGGRGRPPADWCADHRHARGQAAGRPFRSLAAWPSSNVWRVPSRAWSFLNRRGYAPVLACAACGWTSACHRCAANLVLHLADQLPALPPLRLRGAVPKLCPSCGNQDLSAFGRGTQRLESGPQPSAFRRPASCASTVTRRAARKQWEALAARIQGGEADILVGTQMLAKGHDFPKLTLVGAIAPDAALFAADWRAPERLFAQLMQVAGRAGRAERPGEVLLQTQFPEHPLYAALVQA
jgi:hypothetical protein